MQKYIIEGGKKLNGEMQVYSAKNCVLALLAASVLTNEQIVIHNCPKITDVLNMIKILESLGVKVAWSEDNVIVDSECISSNEIPEHFAKEIRSSIFLMGSIIGRLKTAKAVFPGGCDIGLRPIDLHLKGLRALNIRIRETGGYLLCDGREARGGYIHLDFPSVGATENIIMASVLIDGTTIITNVAKEPEVVSLAQFLIKMGAKIYGAGTSTITIEGVKKLHGIEYTPIPDRIVAGTYALAVCMTGGEVVINNCCIRDLEALISKINGNSAEIINYDNKLIVKAYNRPISVKNIETQPYPGFPTDLQAQILALQTVSAGACIIVENMFETRYKHVGELMKMGADIIVRERVAMVRGVDRLHGAEVYASDLRAGAALVLAGLNAEGQTTVNNIYHIDRGYYMLDNALNSAGADIKRI